MRHRIFIAINLPKDIKQKLADYQAKIEKLFAPHGNEVSRSGLAKWTKKDNLHITLIFLGYLSDQELLEVCRITRETAEKKQSFIVNLNRICYAPPKKIPPRMIWTEGEKSEAFASLKDGLEKALLGARDIRFSLEKRSFSPHITLARIKTWEWKKIEPEERPEIKEELSLSFPVNSVEIMESKLKKGGSEYTVLESVSLEEFPDLQN